MTSTENRHIAVYPVGFLAAARYDWRAWKLARNHPTRIPHETRQLWQHVRARNWRAIRNQFAGYLAEHEYAGTRAGHGWTRNRALADLHQHLDGER